MTDADRAALAAHIQKTTATIEAVRALADWPIAIIASGGDVHFRVDERTSAVVSPSWSASKCVREPDAEPVWTHVYGLPSALAALQAVGVLTGRIDGLPDVDPAGGDVEAVTA